MAATYTITLKGGEKEQAAFDREIYQKEVTLDADKVLVSASGKIYLDIEQITQLLKNGILRDGVFVGFEKYDGFGKTENYFNASNIVDIEKH